MHYTLTAQLPKPITSEEFADAIDGLGEWYDSASHSGAKVELDGSVFGFVRLAWIMAELSSTQSRLTGARFTVALSVD